MFLGCLLMLSYGSYSKLVISRKLVQEISPNFFDDGGRVKDELVMF